MEQKKENAAKDIRKKEPLFTKTQLISSKRYQNRRDALAVLLDDDKSYSFGETDKILNSFMKKQA